MVQECDQGSQALFPDMPRPEQKALASLVTGVVCEGYVLQADQAHTIM
jgi:hypothetical protein